MTDQKKLEVFAKRCFRKIINITWRDKIHNEEVLGQDLHLQIVSKADLCLHRWCSVDLVWSCMLIDGHTPLYYASYWKPSFKGVLHLWALFLKTLCIFSKNKATSDIVSYESGQKCSKELKNDSFTSVETIIVKLQWKMCENQYFPCFEP